MHTIFILMMCASPMNNVGETCMPSFATNTEKACTSFLTAILLKQLNEGKNQRDGVLYYPKCIPVKYREF